MKLSAILKKHRVRKKMYQKEMAAALDISREYYAQLESGKNLPSTPLLIKICNAVEYPDYISLLKGERSFSASEEQQSMCIYCTSLNSAEKKIFSFLLKRICSRSSKIHKKKMNHSFSE